MLQGSAQIQLKRLKIRACRRGTKEMDLIFGRYADSMLDHLSVEELNAFEFVMDENDYDLYNWISGITPTPENHMKIIQDLRNFLSTT